jgi:glycosyltransferase involved in cell wall biosynthesis
VKVLHVITDLKVGGESKHLVHVTASLPAFEHVVSCLAVTTDPAAAPASVRREFEELGVPVVNLGVSPAKPLSLGRAFFRFLGLVRREKPDVIHSTLIHANLMAQPASWLGIPLICSHVVTDPWLQDWQRVVERYSGLRATFLANSDAVAESLVAGGIDRRRIRVLHYGVNCDHFRPEGPFADILPGQEILLGVGRLQPQKGFDDLIEAAALLPTRPTVVLLGEGPLRERLTSRAHELGVRLEIVPAVRDIAPYLRRANVVVLPSLFEGLPNVLLEALATGRPVVASDLPGHREVLCNGDNGILVAPSDVQSLEDGIGRALADDGSLGANGRQAMLADFRWDAYMGRRRLLYESAVSGLDGGRQTDGPVEAGKQEGVVLVVPKAGSEVAEHFAHTFRLADRLSQHAPTAVIVERLVGSRPPADRSVEVRVQRHADNGFVSRSWELLRLAAGLRREGFRSYFVRTSQTAAVPLIVLRRLFGGRVSFWSCGMISKNRLRDLGLRAAVRGELPLRFAFRWADDVVTGTESLADHYSKTYGIPRKRVKVLPNEIDLEWFRPPSADERLKARDKLGIEESERLVLSVHRLSPVRRTLLYIPSVLQAVLDRHDGVRFVIAGGGPEEMEVRRAISRAGLDNRVQMLGTVPHDHVRQLYAAGDIFMMPSYSEGFPRVLLEAMAMGVPIASTDVGGVREILPALYRGRLAHRDRPLELADAVSELLLDPGVAEELAGEGLRWVKQFDAPRVASQLAALVRP